MKKVSILTFVFIFLFIFHNSAFPLCVKVHTANLRSGPGTKYKKTWKVYKYMPFKKILRRKARDGYYWYKIKDVDGDIHWIRNDLVMDRFDCAVVKVEEANVRSGPGLKYRKTKAFAKEPAIKYYSFKVLKRKGRWVKVIDEYNNSGWIFRKLLWIY